MICPECQAEIPYSSIFCNKCGQKLGTCRKCQKMNPPGSKFFLACGYPMDEALASDKPTQSRMRNGSRSRRCFRI